MVHNIYSQQHYGNDKETHVSSLIQVIICGFSFVRAAVACSITHLRQLLQGYLKLLTVPVFCPFTLISLWMPLVLIIVIRFVFSALISISYLVHVLLRPSTSFSCSSLATESMPWANYSRLMLVLPPMLTFFIPFSQGIRHKPFKKILKPFNWTVITA